MTGEQQDTQDGWRLWRVATFLAFVLSGVGIIWFGWQSLRAGSDLGFSGQRLFLAIASGIFIVAILSSIIRFLSQNSAFKEASLFSKLFLIVAVTSALFSAISSAIGFGLLTSQETTDIFRNQILPPAFGVFVFFLATAIWVGGAEMVRNRDWFRGFDGTTGGHGFLGDMLHFLERCVKLFVVMPILGIVLFFVSTWTSVVGIAGVDAVRFQYSGELGRLQTECVNAATFRQKDQLFLDDLRLSITDVKRAARSEEAGSQTGIAGRGAATGYFDGVAAWLTTLERSVAVLIEAPQPDMNTGENLSPYRDGLCTAKLDHLKDQLNSNAYVNYDLWARTFEADYEDFRLIIGGWRTDTRIRELLEQQLINFDRANPKPQVIAGSRQARVIDDYAASVKAALESLTRKQKARRPKRVLPSADDIAPERGLLIIQKAFAPKTEPFEPKKKKRIRAVDEVIAPLSTITTRDAPLKFFNIFSDIWALSLSWDFASYILLLAYLFFPSAERKREFKDRAVG